jgi:hypothetical protein
MYCRLLYCTCSLGKASLSLGLVSKQRKQLNRLGRRRVGDVVDLTSVKGPLPSTNSPVA